MVRTTCKNTEKRQICRKKNCQKYQEYQETQYHN